MDEFSHVLVAVDFSKPASAAFEYALAMSARHGAELTAVHAIPPNESYRWQAHARTALLNRLRHEAAQAQVRLHTRVQSGDAAAIILLQARSLRPDVIVIGTHQRRGIHWLRPTSVAERVARKADVPVLLVPARRVTTTWPRSLKAAPADFRSVSDGAIDEASPLTTSPDDRATPDHAHERRPAA